MQLKSLVFIALISAVVILPRASFVHGMECLIVLIDFPNRAVDVNCVQLLTSYAEQVGACHAAWAQ